MNYKKIILSLFALLPVMAFAQPKVIKPNVTTKTSFAIFIDAASYAKVRSSVEKYRDVVEKDGLATYIIVNDWKRPEEIKAVIADLYKGKMTLEGVVFVGDIPIPMIRDAQYLTSAFKMNQETDWKESSVPSDRYYDDFDLKFDYIKQDAEMPLYHYYSIKLDSKHYLNSDIYSARIKPLERAGIDKYELLDKYFQKVVKVRSAPNKLDNMFVYRGYGYNSEAEDAWAGEQIALHEQLPSMFKTGSRIRFYDFDSAWPLKNNLLEEMQDENVDIALGHHHGLPKGQYLNNYQNGSHIGKAIDFVKRSVRRDVRSGIWAYIGMNYDVPESWLDGAFTDSVRVADSIYNLVLNVSVEDIYGLRPNAKFAIFDACHNGSFHLPEYIAGAYIFSDGQCIVAQGNSVNGVQDKWSYEYFGLFDYGLRIGQWGRHVHFLETHIIGDPTYRFANSAEPGFDINEAIALKGGDNNFWLKLLDHKSADVQAMAMRKLTDNGYPKVAEILKKKFMESPYGVVRMEAMTRLSDKNNSDLIEILKLAPEDNYELVRRMGVALIAKNGSDELIPPFVKSLLTDKFSGRVQDNYERIITCMDKAKTRAEIARQVNSSERYLDKEEIQKSLYALIEMRYKFNEDFLKILDKNEPLESRALYIWTFRSNQTHFPLPQLIDFTLDKTEDAGLRMKMLEAFGWFTYSHYKPQIIEACDKIIAANETPALVAEAKKTKSRLSVH